MDLNEIKSKIFPKYEHDREFESYVSSLLRLNYLEGDAVTGIGKQIATKGVESLTDSQIKTFFRHGLMKGNYKEYCDLCDQPILWTEMLDALEDEHCAHCRHVLNKTFRE